MPRSAKATQGPRFLPEIDLKRMRRYSNRKAELESALIKAQLELTEATLELSQVNAEYQTFQNEIAARHGLVGEFTVAPDGLIIDLVRKARTEAAG